MTDRLCLIGIDIGGTKTSARVAGCTASGPQTMTVPTAVGSPTSVLHGTINVIESLLSDASQSALGAIGIGVPGQIDQTLGTVRLARNLGIGAEAFALGPALSNHFGIPVAIENDVRATALGLYARAKEPKPSTLTYLAIGTGLSVGTVIGGRLFRGSRGIAGEIGQIILGECADGLNTIEIEIANPDLVARAADVGLERSAYLRTHAPDIMFTLAATVNTIFMAYDPDSLVVGGGVGTAPGFFEALMDSVASIQSRSAVAAEFVNPHRIRVLASDDPIATESALVLAAQAEASSRETIVA